MTEDIPKRDAAKVREQLTTVAAQLLVEIDVILSSNRWVIINNGSASTNHRLYDAAALRHVAALLRDLVICAETNQELATRILGRAHVEAWLTAVYLHFGGPDALRRVAENTRLGTELLDAAIKRHDRELGQARSKARKRQKAVREANNDLAFWNSQFPEEEPNTLHSEPYVPRQPKTGVDLSSRITDFEGFDAKSLTVAQVTDELSKLGPTIGFANEIFTQIYLYYRLLSAASVHPNLHLYDSYFYREAPNSEYLHTASESTTNSAVERAMTTAIYATSLLAIWVLGDAGSDTPIADVVRASLEPDPTAGWTPGVDHRSDDSP